MTYRSPRFLLSSSGWLIVAILLLAAGLRIWGLSFGLPYIYHPDEANGVWRAQHMLQTGDLNPHFFHWPSLIFYLMTALYGIHFAFGKLLGVFSSTADLPSPIMVAMAVGRMPMPGVWLLSRLMMMGFGLGAVALAYITGKKLTGRQEVGVVAAAFMAISPTLVIHSRFIAPDVLTIFFVSLAFYGSVGVFKDGRTRYYILSGIAIGLTASTKYNGASIALALVLAHFLRYGFSGLKQPRIYGAFLLSGLTFVAAVPFAILDYQTFVTDLRFDAQNYSTGHAGMQGESFKWYIEYLWRVEGPVVLLSIFGVALAFYSRSRELYL